MQTKSVKSFRRNYIVWTALHASLFATFFVFDTLGFVPTAWSGWSRVLFLPYCLVALFLLIIPFFFFQVPRLWLAFAIHAHKKVKRNLDKILLQGM